MKALNAKQLQHCLHEQVVVECVCRITLAHAFHMCEHGPSLKTFVFIVDLLVLKSDVFALLKIVEN